MAVLIIETATGDDVVLVCRLAAGDWLELTEFADATGEIEIASTQADAINADAVGNAWLIRNREVFRLLGLCVSAAEQLPTTPPQTLLRATWDSLECYA